MATAVRLRALGRPPVFAGPGEGGAGPSDVLTLNDDVRACFVRKGKR